MSEVNNTVKVMPRGDLKRLYVGMTILFWSLLLPTVIINGVAFSLPWLGYSFSPIYYFYLIFVFSGVLLTSATWLIASTMWRLDTSFKSIGLCFLIAVFMETALWVIVQMLRSLIMDDRIGYWSYAGTFFIRNIAEFIAVLIGINFFHRWLRFWRFTSLAEKFDNYFWIYFIVMLGLDVIDYLIEYSEFGAIYFLLVSSNIVVCCWGFLLLYHIRNCIGRIVRSECIQCGYLLFGLPNPRCPECGTNVLIVTET